MTVSELYLRLYSEEPDEELPVYKQVEEITPAILVCGSYIAVYATEHLSGERIRQWVKLAGSKIEKYWQLLHEDPNCEYLVYDNYIFKNERLADHRELLVQRLTCPLYYLENCPPLYDNRKTLIEFSYDRYGVEFVSIAKGEVEELF